MAFRPSGSRGTIVLSRVCRCPVSSGTGPIMPVPLAPGSWSDRRFCRRHRRWLDARAGIDHGREAVDRSGDRLAQDMPRGLDRPGLGLPAFICRTLSLELLFNHMVVDEPCGSWIGDHGVSPVVRVSQDPDRSWKGLEREVLCPRAVSRGLRQLGMHASLARARTHFRTRFPVFMSGESGTRCPCTLRHPFGSSV